MMNPRKEGQSDHRLSETVTTILEALLIALAIRTIFFQPFNIPSASMEPTLLIGDYLFVSKFSYGYSRYSLGRRTRDGSGQVTTVYDRNVGVYLDFIDRALAAEPSLFGLIVDEFVRSFRSMEWRSSGTGLQILWGVIPAGPRRLMRRRFRWSSGAKHFPTAYRTIHCNARSAPDFPTIPTSIRYRPAISS